MDKPPGSSGLDVLLPQPATAQRMPSVVNDDDRSDMGRMFRCWPSAASRGSSPAPIAGPTAVPSC